MTPEPFVDRVARFADTWLANPAARLAFALLIREAGTSPHEDALVNWIDVEVAIGRRTRPLAAAGHETTEERMKAEP